MSNRLSVTILLLVATAASVAQTKAYRTENVVIAVMDGTHYDRTFGDPDHELVPHLWNDLRPQGTYYTNFYNNGVTITMAGHSTIMTGVWQYSRNRGPLQTRPTIIQYLADEIGLRPKEAWVVFGKGFYAYNPETSFPTYRSSYEPGFINGIGETTYQDDYNVLTKVMQVMSEDKPRFLFVNFGTTDHTAHSGDWQVHVGAVKNNDAVLYKLWTGIQSDPHYRDKTTLIITNDHGYMDEGHHDGFAEHGDSSEGSRHIMLMILGPDTIKNRRVDTFAYQIDIAPTVGELLGFQTPLAEGIPLRDSFVDFKGINRNEGRTDRAKQALAIDRAAQANVVGQLADGVLRKYNSNLKSLIPSTNSDFLLWGMLSAYDKTGDARYLDFVRSWVSQAPEVANSFDAAFVRAELAYRTQDRIARHQLVAGAIPIAREVIAHLEQSDIQEQQIERFVLAMVFVSSVAEISHDEPLWTRAAEVYVRRVQQIDEQRTVGRITTLGSSTSPHPERKEGEVVEQTGKVLPDVQSRSMLPEDPWYLLGATFVRSHGLPFKGENLPDLPFFGAEVLYRSYLMISQLRYPGDVWSDPFTSALTIAAIREARRRVTLKGALYDGADGLTQFDLSRLRPKSPMPKVEQVREVTQERITRMNYNVQYGFPRYQAFDFTIDLLRLYANQAQDDLTIGVFLLALDKERHITLDAFVPAPR